MRSCCLCYCQCTIHSRLHFVCKLPYGSSGPAVITLMRKGLKTPVHMMQLRQPVQLQQLPCCQLAERTAAAAAHQPTMTCEGATF